MSTYKNKVVLNYPISAVFKVFRNTAKRDFLKFDEENAVGSSVERNVGAYSIRSTNMKIEITDYKANEIYEITSVQDSTVYKSRYEFKQLDGQTTEINVVESMNTTGAWNNINTLIAGIFFRGRVRKRFGYFVKGLEGEVENIIRKS